MMQKLYGISRRLFDENNEEIVFAKGKGAYVYDTQGKSYIDMLLGYGPIILGHGNETYARELAKEIEYGTLFPSYGKKQYELAEMISSKYPNHQLIALYQSGSDSLDSVFRICRLITGKPKLIRFGYIGWHDNLLMGGFNWHEPVNSCAFYKASNNLPGIENNQAYNWDGRSAESFEVLTKSRDVACFIFDAYQLQRQKIDIESVIRICKEKGILVVLDETKTAGRVSTFGYFKDTLEYDFTILGKAISNGYPVSLLLGHHKYASVNYDTIKIAGTYARDCLCCSSILTTVRIMSQNNLYKVISDAGKAISEKMNDCLDRVLKNKDIAVRTMLDGAILEFQFSDQFACDFSKRKRFADFLLKNGLLIQDGHCFYVSAAHANCIEDIGIRFQTALEEFCADKVKSCC